MGTPNPTLQRSSDAVAGLGKWISVHTDAAGTTGANEASGGGYSRQAAAWTPDGAGNNTSGQVQIALPPGQFVEGGVNSTESGSAVAVVSDLAATTNSTGGTLAAGSYVWVITTTNFSGETTSSNEVSATLTGTTSSVGLSWTLPDGADGVKVYRGTVAGSENVLVATLGAVSTYTDTGAAGTSATPPADNTASTFVGSEAFANGVIVISGAGANLKVTPIISSS